MKVIITIALLIIGFTSIAQTYHFRKVTIRTLDEVVTYDKDYLVKKANGYVYFDKILYQGSQGWANRIIDSTNKGVYILDYHWITTFDSLKLSVDGCKLFNRTLDYILFYN